MAITLSGNATSTFSSNITSSTGDLTLGDGNLVVADGHGIDFSATGNGSGSMTSELFSDYEEGTFTPTLTFSTPGTSSFSYEGQTGGYYTKVGRFVHCRCEIRLSAFSKGTASGDLEIHGLPYAANALDNFGQFIGNFASFNAPLPTTAGDYPVVVIPTGNSIASLRRIRSNGAWIEMPDPDANSQYKVDFQYYT